MYTNYFDILFGVNYANNFNKRLCHIFTIVFCAY